jgi:hypothetical protein
MSQNCYIKSSAFLFREYTRHGRIPRGGDTLTRDFLVCTRGYRSRRKNENGVQAAFRLEGTKLTVEANSTIRVARVHTEVAKRPGKEAIYLGTTNDSLGGAMMVERIRRWCDGESFARSKAGFL